MAKLNNDILLNELTDGVLRLTLNDDQRRNALSVDMLSQITDALASAADDTSVRVIVLAAIGVLPSVVVNWASGGECCKIAHSFNDGSWLTCSRQHQVNPVRFQTPLRLNRKD